MSIQLILVRHGVAENLSQGICDFDRRLTSAGVQLLEKTIWRLRPFRRTSEDTIILTSPRVRAFQTAELVASVFHTEDIQHKVFVDEGCFSELVNFLDKLSANEDHTVFVVGHQPTLGYWSNILCGQDLPFKKGAAASFTVPDREIGKAKLDWFFQPEDMLSLHDRGSADERIETYAVVISRLMKGLLAVLKAFDLGEADVETVHQIRVFSRKAAAALLLYRQILRKPVFSDTRRTLKQVTRIFSGLRDIDVLTEAFQRYSSEIPVRSGTNKEIAGNLSRIRLEEEVSARDQMSPGRLLRRIESVSSKKMIMETFFASNSRGTKPFDAVVSLGKHRVKLLRAAAEVDAKDEKEVHAFRVSARQLRYMTELCGDPEAMPVCIHGMSLEDIQRDFGRLCDARRGIRILSRMQVHRRSRRSVGKESFADYLARMEDEAKNDLYGSFFARKGVEGTVSSPAVPPPGRESSQKDVED